MTPPLDQHLTVLAFGDVLPGTWRRRPGHTLGLAGLRQLLARTARGARVVPLPTGPAVGAGGRRGLVSLVFAGGCPGHARYVAPMLEALSLPGHICVPLERLGTPGGLNLADLAALRHMQGVRCEVDLSGAPPEASWQVAHRLRCAQSVLRRWTGQAPRYVHLSGPPPDARLALVLGNNAFDGAVSTGIRRHCRLGGLRMFAAARPPRHLRWGLPGCLWSPGSRGGD